MAQNPVPCLGYGSLRVSPYAGYPAICSTATPRVAEPAWHRAARRQRAQDRALTFFAKAASRLDEHHGSSSGMAWADVVRNSSMVSASLSSWLRDNGFLDEVTEAVRQTKLVKADVQRLKQLREQARGDAGMLSKAQLRSLKPQNVHFKDGKLLNLTVDGSPGGAPRGGKVKGKGTKSKSAAPASSEAELVALRAQVSELMAHIRSGTPLVAAGAAATEPRSSQSRGGKVKTCHTCGSKDHLRAKCPVEQEIAKLERWQSLLQDDSCPLAPEHRNQQLHAAGARIDALKRETEEAKERSILPEQLVGARRAELQTRAEALSAARQRLEASENECDRLQALIETQRQEVDTEVQAFRKAEEALEEAQRRLSGAVSETMAAPPAPQTAPVPPNTLSARGLEALKSLEAHIKGLTEGANMQLIDEEYQQLEAAAAGRPIQSKLAFVLDKLKREGARQLQIVGFELSKEPEPMVAEIASATLAAPPPARPRAEGGLGDHPRMPIRAPVREFPGPYQGHKVAAEARARGLHRTAPLTKDPLWVAVNTTVAGGSVMAGAAEAAAAPVEAAPASGEAVFLGIAA